MTQFLGLVLLGMLSVSASAPTADVTTYTNVPLLMPNVQPKKADTYLCVPLKMNATETYITGFLPEANMNIAHHMLLYGCDTPGSQKDVWNCGEMANKGGELKNAPTCKSGAKILYAWAMDAPSLSLPKDVAFEVGGKTSVKYLVLQVHYKNVSTFLNGGTDKSGITLKTSTKPYPKTAGVYLMGTNGKIPAHSTTYMETACPYPEENLVIHPFAYRTHAHTLGRVVSGYRIRQGEWSEIGRMDPRKPEMFYNATIPNMEVKHGDILAARCTMVNDLDHAVAIGSTQLDEMCNFYIMYWVDGNRIMDDEYCFTQGPPSWSWENFMFGDMNLAAKPTDMSTIPDTSETFVATATGNTEPGNTEQPEEEEEEEEENVSLESLLDELGTDELGSILNDLSQRERPSRDEEQDEYYYNYGEA